MTSETDQLVQLFANMLDQDQQKRENASNLITESAKAKPDAFIQTLLGVLKGTKI